MELVQAKDKELAEAQEQLKQQVHINNSGNLNPESSKAAKLSGYIYLFTVDVLRVSFTFSSNTSLDSVSKLCDIQPLIDEGDYRKMCARINENITKCKVKMKAEDGWLKRVKDTVFVYIFPKTVALSSANVHRLFQIPTTRLECPPTNHTWITVEDLSTVLVIDEREKVRLSLECAKEKKAALTALNASTEEQDQVIMNLEAQLQSSSIIPYMEPYIRDAFTRTLQDKKVAAEKEKVLDEHYTVFKGRVDVVIYPTGKTDLAAVVSPSVAGDDDDSDVSVELKRMMEQATQQCLAECHAFLASLTVTKLNETLVDQSTGYALELRRGACRLHTIKMMFKHGATEIYSYPETDEIGKITSLINHMLIQLHH